MTTNQFKKGTLELCIMALISQGKHYGYDLVCVLRKNDLVVAEGTVYPILSRLRKEGLLNHKWVESKQGPPRKYYRITKKGRQKLKNDLQSWTKLSENVNQIITKAKIKKKKNNLNF